MNNKNIDKIIAAPMSNILIQKILNNRANVVLLSDIIPQKYNNIDEVFDNTNHIFLFLQTNENIGHWLLLFKNNNNVYYYDSYGAYPLIYLDKIKTNQTKFLLQLLKISKYEIYYNNIKYQEMDEDINTCGRHCSLVCIMNTMFNNFTLVDYYNILNYWKHKHNKSYDEIVSFMINFIENKYKI